ncbi:MAG: ATP-dependent zinc protease [Pseudomonadales bacterium]
MIAAVAGCANLQGAGQASEVAALRDEVQALQASLANTQKSLLISSAAEADQRAAVSAELKGLDSALARLPAKLSNVCQQSESTPPPSCDEERLVVKIDDRMVVGELEYVWLEPPGISLTARIDTGAESSSVNAQNLVEFERDGDDWVRFEWALQGKTTSIERPIKRYVRVVQQADPDGTRRPVVSLRLRIGDIEDDFDFSLADRSHLDHQMILGRNFLTDVAVVDVGRKFVQPAITSKAE